MAADSTTLGEPAATELDVVSRVDDESHENVDHRLEGALEVGESIRDVGSTMATDASREKSETGKENHDYVTGFKLLAVMGSVTLTAFLMLLDGSIIGTVSWHTETPTDWVLRFCSEKDTDPVALR